MRFNQPPTQDPTSTSTSTSTSNTEPMSLEQILNMDVVGSMEGLLNDNSTDKDTDETQLADLYRYLNNADGTLFDEVANVGVKEPFDFSTAFSAPTNASFPPPFDFNAFIASNLDPKSTTAAPEVPGSPINFSLSPSSGGEGRSLSPVTTRDEEMSISSTSRQPTTTTRAKKTSTNKTKRKSVGPVVVSKPAFDEDEDVKEFIMEGLDEDEDDEDEEGLAPVEILNIKDKKKRESKASVSKLATSELHKTSGRSQLGPVPDWIDKPPPEVYKNLSSKEKRQLRNKISARNFRHRRKEYIGTLEEAVQARDSVISNLRSQMEELKLENLELKRENKEIKARWDEMLSKINVSVTPKSPNTIAAALRGASSIPQVNLNKDVGVNGKRWGQNTFGGGITSVHRTLVPELRLSDSSSVSASSSTSSSPLSFSENVPPPVYSSMNMNPALNNLSPIQASLLPLFTSHLRTSGLPGKAEGKGVHDDFIGSNPYYLRPDMVEEYRSQLYGKLAHNLAHSAIIQKAGGVDATMDDAERRIRSSPLVAGGWKPAFFTSPKSTEKKLPKDSSPPPSYTEPSALMASQIPHRHQVPPIQSTDGSLLTKMAETFWLTFTGHNDIPVESRPRRKSISIFKEKQPLGGDGLDDIGSRLGNMKLSETTKGEVKK